MSFNDINYTQFDYVDIITHSLKKKPFCAFLKNFSLQQIPFTFINFLKLHILLIKLTERMYFFSIDICAIINERIICQFSITSFTPKISKITRKFGNKIARAHLHTAELGGSSHATLCTGCSILIL